MVASDDKLIPLLDAPDVKIRGAALDLLCSSFATDRRILTGIFHAWDQFGVEEAFPEFSMLSHLSVGNDAVEQCIERAKSMSHQRALTDKRCRCAGKLIEAISVASPVVFQDHMEVLIGLKGTSKIFFRVDTHHMAQRCQMLSCTTSELVSFVENGAQDEKADALESLLIRGEAEEYVQQGLSEGENLISRSPLLDACLGLATRYPLHGNEEKLAMLIDHQDSTLADAATLGLSHLRNSHSLTHIANLFPQYSRQAQLRSIDVVRRSRLEKSSELLRFLKAHAMDGTVQEALKVAEILQFDFQYLEDWLEAFLVVTDVSIHRIRSLISVAKSIVQGLPDDDVRRMRELVRSRIKDFNS